MPINFAQSSDVFTSKIPRTVSVFDPTGGCPTTRSNPILSLTFTTTSAKSSVIIQGEIIRARYNNSQTTCEMYLFGPGYPGISSSSSVGNQMLTAFKDFNDNVSGEWDNATIRWMGYVPAGTHTFYYQSSDVCVNFWGCTAPWGNINAIIFE
jgi:hypothetical protein